MPVRLRREEIVTIRVLHERGENHCQIARRLGVTEGTVRYHLGRGDRPDGRARKQFLAECWADQITAWHEAHAKGPRPGNVRELYEYLVHECGYKGSYQSVLRYVRHRWGRPPVRTYRRVETPPGVQAQTDWVHFRRVRLVSEGEVKRQLFLMGLSFSRMMAAVWMEGMDQLRWLEGHNESFRRLGGIAAVNRIDNVRTAIEAGAGSQGRIHPTYRAYARLVGFHIEACPPYAPEAKGKVEAKARLSRLRLDPGERVFEDDEELQEWTDRQVEGWAKRAICPATGKTVWESWQYEREFLRPLGVLPEPFDVVVTRPVHKDCLVHFEGRAYAVPFPLVGRRVEVRGCAGKVQIVAEGRIVKEYPRGTEERILIDPSCYEGPSTQRVCAPPPLGRMGRRIQEIAAMPVERRPVDLYAALAEVAR